MDNARLAVCARRLFCAIILFFLPVTLVSASSPPNLLWDNYVSGLADGLATDSSQNVYASRTILGAPGGADAAITKYDASGNPLWTTQTSSSLKDTGFTISVDANDNVSDFGYVRGNSVGGNDQMVVDRYDSTGNLLQTTLIPRAAPILTLPRQQATLQEMCCLRVTKPTITLS
jgi:hypothetical protein